MRIDVNRELCSGHGRCWTLAPDVFDADDDGYCATISIEVRPGHEQEALKGVRSCPERAITAVE